jgi:hypothetical protein
MEFSYLRSGINSSADHETRNAAENRKAKLITATAGTMVDLGRVAAIP